MVLNRSDMVVLGDPLAGDRARLRVLPGFGGVALFDADFHNFSFAPHFHDTLMIGLILDGEKYFRRGRGQNRVARGGLSVVNPGDIHTGGVVRGGEHLRYVAVYPSAALTAETGLADAAFQAAVINDDGLAVLFASALSYDTASAEAEETLLIALAKLGARYGSKYNLPSTGCRPAFRRARDYIEASLGSSLRLEEIAANAGVGPRHLIRCFHQALGVTPQQYVRQARVRTASELIRKGESLGQASAASGFADQAHMTRTFRSVMGITPAAFALSWRDGLQ